jgi:bile acid:Na+ symporter, BASS family
MTQFFLQYEHILAGLQVALTMFGMGLILTKDDFLNIVKYPKLVIIGLLLIFVACPFITYLASKAVNLSPGFAMGFIIIAALPGGSGSNLFTHMAKANTPLSIALTVAGSILCLFLTPLALHFTLGDFLPETFEMPAKEIAINIVFYLLMPLLIGMYMKNIFKNAEKLSKTIIRIAMLILLLFVCGSFNTGRIDFSNQSFESMIHVIALGLGFSLVGNIFLFAIKTKYEDLIAVVLEMTFRNISLGFLIVLSIFPGEAGQSQVSKDIMFCLLFYGGYAIIGAMITVAAAHARQRSLDRKANI